MQLRDAIAAAGMTPPERIVSGRFMRFPGAGKGRSNDAGWCRLITPTMAIYGDWSTGLSQVWRDDAHQDSREAKRLLAEAREQERRFAAERRRRQQDAAERAADAVRSAVPSTHPYLARKGFPSHEGLVRDGKLIVPMRDARCYRDLINVQEISEDGTKRFIAGGRARGAIYRMGPSGPQRTLLCEGYATGLSLHEAARRLPWLTAVIVCFSAGNLEIVAELFPKSVVMADNDLSGAGERAALRTGLKWTMPYDVGTDFNDLHVSMGLHVLVERLREALRR